MIKAFYTARYGSPIFLYITSHFILINLFGRFCTSIASGLSFLFFSILITLSLNSKAFTEIYKKNRKNIFISFCFVITVLFSYAFESATITEVFNVISDAESETYEKMWFVLIITTISILLCCFGTSTLNKISNILFILPFIILIPCVFSCISNGISYTGFIETDINSIFSEIVSGALVSLIYAADRIIVNNFADGKNGFKCKYIKYGSIISIVFIFTVGTLLRLLFGKVLYSNLTAPIFSASGTAGAVEFDEILLIIFSICLLYRFACKLSFIMNFFKRSFQNKNLWLIPTVFVACASGIVGILAIKDTWSFIVTAAITGILNLISFIILPYITSIFKTN